MQKARKRLLITGCALIAIAVMLILYAVLIGTGVINSRQRSLVIRAGTAEKAYDGVELVCEEWTLVHGELKSGHTIVPAFSGSQLAPGQSANQVTVRIVDGNNTDVTGEYSIEYLSGTLSVYSTKLHIVASDLSKTYDGTPLTPTGNEWMLESGALMLGHQIQATFSASLTEVGTCESPISALITDEAGNDVTGLYEIQYTAGTLKVNPRPITLSSPSESKVYDGLPFVRDHVELIGGSLLEGHELRYTFPESIKTVGTAENSFNVSVVDANGADVTHCYSVSTECGQLTIDPLEIVVESASVKKKYDGAELTASTAQITMGALIEGHTLSVNVTGSQTEIGSSPNIFTVDILDGNGVSVISNYRVQAVTGTLTVVEFLVDDGTSPTPGAQMSSGINGSNPLDDNTPVLNFQSDVSGSIYLRLQSFGSYRNFSWDLSPAVPEMADNFNPLYWIGSALARQGQELSHLDVQWLIDPQGCLVPYYVQSELDISADDSFAPIGNKTYSLDFFSYDMLDTLSNKASSITPDPAYAEAELAYRAFVYANFLEIPDESLRKVITRHLKEAHISPLSDTLIRDVATYVQNVAVYDLTAGMAPDGVDPIIFFLEESQRGVCRHYASAAVMMYRALGIPARYVVGYLGNSNPNALSTVTAMQAHAWVEVYIDGLGWLPVEVTGGGSGIAEEEAEPQIPLIVKPVTVLGIADGTEYRATKNRLVGNLDPKHEFDCTYEGSRTEPGISNSYIGGFTIVDTETGENVTHLYSVETVPGLIHVVKQESELDDIEEKIWLVIKPADVSAPYTGNPVTPIGWDYADKSDKLKDGHEPVYTLTGEKTVPGTETSYIEVQQIIDQKTGADVTDQYDISCMEGRIEVLAPEFYVTVKPQDVYEHYDGREFSPQTWEYAEDSDEFLAGHTPIFTYAGTLTRPGRIDSVIVDYKIVDTETGEDVTYLYNIYTQSGVIEVDLAIVVKPADVIVTFTGEAHAATDWVYVDGSSGSLLPEHELICNYAGAQTFPGSSASDLTDIAIVDKDTGEDVTEIYTISSFQGTISVDPIILVLKADDLSGVFKGSPYTVNTYSYLEDSEELLADHELTCTVNGSLLFAGTTHSSIENIVITNTVTGEDMTQGYSVSAQTGTITVEPIVLNIKADDLSGVFKGSPYTVNTYSYLEDSEELLADHELTCTVNGSLLFAGTTHSSIENIVITNTVTGEDMTQGYSVSAQTGTITVEPITLNVKPKDVVGLADGTTYTANEWEYMDGSDTLLPNHKLSCNFTGSQREIGTSASYMTDIVIQDLTSGVDVTLGYSISDSSGLITVEESNEPIVLLVKPADVVGVPTQSGREYKATTWDYMDNSGVLKPNHDLFCDYIGARSELGQSTSYMENVVIRDMETGLDVTDQYDISTSPGIITVKTISISIKPADVTAEYTGEPIGPSGWEYAPLTQENLLDGHELIYTFSDPPTDIGTYSGSIVSYSIIDIATQEDVTSGYIVSRTEGTIAVIPISLAIKPDDVSSVYTGMELNATGWSITNGRLLDGHEVVIGGIDGVQIRPGTSNSTLRDIVIRDSETEEDMTHLYDIEALPGTITVDYASYLIIKPVDIQGMFTGTAYTATDWEFIPESGELLAGHQLSCTYSGSYTYPLWGATFEASCQPTSIASYTITDADGNDVTDLYHVTSKDGYIAIMGYEFTVKPTDLIVQYNGQTHTAPADGYAFSDISYFDNTAELLANYDVVVQLNGSRTDFGKSAITVTDVQVYDKDGNNVTPAFKITNKTATLQIYAEKLTIKTEGANKTYDGTPLTNENWSWEGQLMEGHSLTVEMKTSITNVGTVKNQPTVRITAQDGTDVTDWYIIEVSAGTLEIKPIILEVTSNSATAPYVPGQTLTCHEYTITQGALAEGETIVVVITGAQSSVGYSENTIRWEDIRIYRNGVDTTSNYSISTIAGKLTVTPPVNA